jgi:DNA-binding MarR family transcriptional regulator
MSLEEEIGQKEFRSEKQKALINLMFTHNSLVNRMNGLFKSFDITRQQFNVLRILRGAYPEAVSINDIKCRMLDKMSDASRIVERLRLKKLIKRIPNKIDRRAVDVKITSEGLTLLEKTDPLINEFESVFNALSHDEIQDLNQSLDKIRRSCQV